MKPFHGKSMGYNLYVTNVGLPRIAGLVWFIPHIYMCRVQFECGKSGETLRSWVPVFQT